ncbi:MAG: alpha-amylase/4-alpha-glucanotransferase domain-containing protein [bacterium]
MKRIAAPAAKPLEKLPLLLGIHCHQPEGNFGSVLEQCYQDAYLPFIALLEEFPRVRLTLHYTGTLYEFFEAKHPEFLARVAALVARGQVEILGGAWYEPIVSVIPERDAVGQIERMTSEVERLFGTRPVGAWLAERVWEPSLPSLLSRAGARYTVLDETHFRYAGLEGDAVLGHYITEKRGDATLVVPIDKGLRYLIPFREVSELLDYLRAIRERTGGGIAVTYADDGEKFGVWPGTREWVFEKGWLREFFRAISQADWIESLPIGEYVGRAEPRGRVYLPAASYDEMTEWALPVDVELAFEEILAEKKAWPGGDRLNPFLRGGFWDNFFAKYPEANQLHKRMLRASDAVARAAAKSRGASTRLAQARERLYRSQVNCPYWHGVFGGLYLNYLRANAYSNMIAAETVAEEIARGKPRWIARETIDFDRDGHPEIVLSSDSALVVVAPRRGGTILEWDSRDPAVNLTDVLARRREAYHRKVIAAAEATAAIVAAEAAATRAAEASAIGAVVAAVAGAASASDSSSAIAPGGGVADTTTAAPHETAPDEPRSIHDIDSPVSADLIAHLVDDGGPRVSLRDRVFDRAVTLDLVARAAAIDLARLSDAAYAWRFDPDDDAGVILSAETEIVPAQNASGDSVASEGEGGRSANTTVSAGRLAIEKRIRLAPRANAITVDYTLTNAGRLAIDAFFVTELNLTLHAGDAEDRYLLIDGVRPDDARLASRGIAPATRRVELVDGWRDLTVSLQFDRPAEIWRYPVMTVSRSEAGFELNYQGTCLLPIVPLALAAEESTTFQIELSTRKGQPRIAPSKRTPAQRRARKERP